MTWLPGPVAGAFLYLHVSVDIFSRKIVGREVHDRAPAGFAAQVLERAVRSERCLTGPVVLHADNGSPMKGATMKVTMKRLGVIASFGRPRVGNDNPFPEALLRSCKYTPNWPTPPEQRPEAFDAVGLRHPLTCSPTECLTRR